LSRVRAPSLTPTTPQVRGGFSEIAVSLSTPVSNVLTPEQQKAADSLAGAATTFLGQFDEPGANMWELWKKRDDVAGEFLCWHAVAWSRLATVGKVEPL
jgi:hypothetical protein